MMVHAALFNLDAARLEVLPRAISTRGKRWCIQPSCRVLSGVMMEMPGGLDCTAASLGANLFQRFCEADPSLLAMAEARGFIKEVVHSKRGEENEEENEEGEEGEEGYFEEAQEEGYFALAAPLPEQSEVCLALLTSFVVATKLIGAAYSSDICSVRLAKVVLKSSRAARKVVVGAGIGMKRSRPPTTGGRSGIAMPTGAGGIENETINLPHRAVEINCTTCLNMEFRLLQALKWKLVLPAAP